MSLASLAAVLLLATGLGFNAQGAEDCAPAGGLSFICGINNSEDLVAVPNTKHLITSSMTPGGGLNLIDTRAKKASNLFPGQVITARHNKTKFAACPSPLDPKLMVLHGLSLRAALGDHYTLYAVNHGGRESIEVFDVAIEGGAPKVTWTGCVLMPDGLVANSAAAFEDGTLLATVVRLPGKTRVDMFAGRPTGAVFQWTPRSSGFKQLPGTELAGNNGIDTSPTDDEFFVVARGGRQVVAFSRKDPSKPARMATVGPFRPDNVRFADDGRMITAGMSDLDASCAVPEDSPEAEKCLRGYIVVAIDPKTMAVSELARGPGTTAFGGATLAVQMGDELWIGTHNADKLAYRPLK